MANLRIDRRDDGGSPYPLDRGTFPIPPAHRRKDDRSRTLPLPGVVPFPRDGRLGFRVGRSWI